MLAGGAGQQVGAEQLDGLVGHVLDEDGPLAGGVLAAGPADAKPAFIDRLQSRLKWVDGELAGKDYLMGTQFTVADAYLFTVLNWSKFIKLDLGSWPLLAAYQARVAARPAVQAALKAEGLIK